MSETNHTQLDIFTQDDEEDTLSVASTAYSVHDSSEERTFTIEKLWKQSQLRLKENELFREIFMKVVSRIRTLSKEEMQANIYENSRKF